MAELIHTCSLSVSGLSGGETWQQSIDHPGWLLCQQLSPSEASSPLPFSSCLSVLINQNYCEMQEMAQAAAQRKLWQGSVSCLGAVIIKISPYYLLQKEADVGL